MNFFNDFFCILVSIVFFSLKSMISCIFESIINYCILIIFFFWSNFLDLSKLVQENNLAQDGLNTEANKKTYELQTYKIEFDKSTKNLRVI